MVILKTIVFNFRKFSLNINPGSILIKDQLYLLILKEPEFYFVFIKFIQS